ncbi:MAG TPA: hypothetical protein VKB78_06525 [Pirellulales bacterium]|nr:hypothetical protein [Pirellulales bacterium]
MNRIVVDQSLTNQLRGIAEPCPIFDPEGNKLGLFQPEVDRSVYDDLQPSVTDEELDRRARAGGFRKLSEIIAELERRA